MTQRGTKHVIKREYLKQHKNIFHLVLILATLLLVVTQLLLPKDQEVLSYEIDIPEEAIRLRILAHSDEEVDQIMKRQVRDDVSQYVSEMIQDADTIEAAREMVTSSITHIKQVVDRTIADADYPHQATVTYGENIIFPTKVYDTHVYLQGEYEAVLITIGAGDGKNWWCVLFPQLCFVDFNGDTTIDEKTHTSTEASEKHKQQKESSETTTEDIKNETEQLDNTKPEPKFWLFDQINAFIHKVSG